MKTPDSKSPAHSRLLAVCIALCGLLASVAGGAETRPVSNILVLGDSLAAGSGVAREDAFPALLQRKIDSQKLPFKVINAGVSGDTTAGGLRRIDWMLKRKIDVLLLELGGNDGLRGIDTKTTQANLQAIIDKAKAKYPTIRIVIAGMQMPPNMGKEYTERFQNIFPEIAKANKAALIPFLLEGIGADPRYNQPDLIHPTPEGHKIVAATVWKTLGPILTGDGKSDASE
ncbi:MAG: acyl-CoA thioesterase-1 [Candidatus Binatia bacterium]|jgi:acyl-CoA thioesterase-1